VKFGTYEWAIKAKRVYICKCRMPLWVALQEMPIRVSRQGEVTRQEEKDIIKAFPEDIGDCKCRNCRYKRIFG
jgi:hypothetical protein